MLCRKGVLETCPSVVWTCMMTTGGRITLAASGCVRPCDSCLCVSFLTVTQQAAVSSVRVYTVFDLIMEPDGHETKSLVAHGAHVPCVRPARCFGRDKMWWWSTSQNKYDIIRLTHPHTCILFLVSAEYSNNYVCLSPGAEPVVFSGFLDNSCLLQHNMPPSAPWEAARQPGRYWWVHAHGRPLRRCALFVLIANMDYVCFILLS